MDFLTLSIPSLPFQDINISRLDSSIKQDLNVYLDHVKKDAEEETPVDTGRLKRGYKKRIDGSFPYIRGKVVNTVPYFPYVEEGTRHREGRFMMSRSVKAHEKEARYIVNNIQTYLEDIV